MACMSIASSSSAFSYVVDEDKNFDILQQIHAPSQPVQQPSSSTHSELKSDLAVPVSLETRSITQPQLLSDIVALQQPSLPNQRSDYPSSIS